MAATTPIPVADSISPPEPVSKTEPGEPETANPALFDDLPDAERWLFVEKARTGAKGAWATGSFDAERNKIIIKAREVQEFSIETARIPIDWERLVIIGIDGRNSELRKRDYSHLRFTRDRQGQWVVLEP